MTSEQSHIAAIDAVSLLTAVVNARNAYDDLPWDDGGVDLWNAETKRWESDSARLASACYFAVDAAANAGIPDAIIEDAAIVLAEISGVWGLAS